MKLILMNIMFFSIGFLPTAYSQDSAITKVDNSTTNSAHAIPIDLIADKGNYDQISGVATYEGNVQVTQGDAKIWADKMTVILIDNSAERIEATGKPVKFTFTGKKQPITGKGNNIVYHVQDKTVELTGQAEVKQGVDVITGSVLKYNLAKEVINGSRVKMTFLPKQ